MKKLLIVLSIFVGIFIAAALAAPYFISPETLKKQALSFLEDTTGRSVRIDGDLSLSIFPSVGVEVGKLQLSNPAGFDDKTPFVAVEHAHISVALLPLLRKDIEFTHFTLDKPLLSLRVNKDGRVNWHFAPRKNTSEIDATNTKSEQANEAVESDSKAINTLQLSDVTINNATFTYNDELTGADYRVEDLNATINVSDLESPISVTADALWHDERVNLTGSIDSYKALFEKGTSANTIASLKTKHLSFNADGKAAMDGFSGDVSVKSDSIKSLLAWLEPKKAPIGIKTPLSLDIKTSLSCNPEICDFNKLTLAVDNIKATGNAKVDFSQSKPSVEYDVFADTLDLNPYMTQAQEVSSSMFMSSAHALHPRWDNKAIDLSAFSFANVSGSFRANTLMSGAVTIARPTIKTMLKSSRLAVDVSEFGIYNGSGTITLAVDANASPMVIDLRTKISHVNLQDLLTAASGSSKVSGDGSIGFNIRTSGNSQAQLVQRLNGSGDFIVENGVYQQVSLLDMFNNVASAFGTAATGSGSTQFTEAKGTFTIREGVIYNNDLRVAIPGTIVEGEGSVDLPNYTLKYRLTPRTVGTTQNAAGETVVRTGAFIPVLISGSIESPKFAPDLKASLKEAIKDPEAFKKSLQNSRKNLKDQIKDPKEALKNLKGIFKGF